MADDAAEPQSSTASRARRSSFAGQTFADLFGTSRPRPSNEGNSPPQQGGAITQAAAQAQRRRLSISTLGLSGSPTASPYGSFRGRQDSVGSANGSFDESAIEEETAPRDPTSAGTPATPFARRMSFGARALRDRGTAGGAGGGGGTGQNGTKSPPAASANPATAKPQTGTISSRDAKGRGSTDFWNENVRARAERTSFVGGGGGSGGSGGGGGGLTAPPVHQRAKSIAVMDPPIREMPKESQRPDHFQERILKGDFYMD
ncbi:hypothetical protein BAUCODRAFT_39606 [Baudoinia panamericana UAMH 10762]|uniref:Uncharacterized protein n=1 Tax=Baudoinia panamericana (strain UAMH 10762) TaxID=717646 RepID=M2MJG8_BAUPA|nr:uncharacterized protein BAUCODRAFT_39606 [Baudoinia panamericana UAMH 10762]EMC91433.1 hypothetical protein BAUCODRAFT_39606 [Baudoinia panamericana UAMH 10762]